MTIQTLRRRRLVVLGLALSVVLGLVISVYFWRQHQREQTAMQAREAGMVAVERDDHANVLEHLGAYLKVFDDDVEALYHYARARRAVQETRGKHLVQAMGVLQRVVDLAPDHVDAHRDLLELYTSCGYNHETLDVADALLARNAYPVDAWRAKGVAYSRLKQYEASRQAIEACLKAAPNDLRASVLWIDLLQQRGTTGTALLAAMRDFRAQRPSSTNIDLLDAYVHRAVGDRQSMVASLRKAMPRVPTDDEHTVLLVMLLDDARLHQEAMAVLERAAANPLSTRSLGELTRRWWEANRYGAIVNRLSGLEPKRRETDGELLGFKAAALFELGRSEEAAVIVQHLKDRGPDSQGAAWSLVLNSVYAAAQRSPRAIVVACRDAMAILPDNAYFAYLSGAAWWSLNENDLALQQWRAASASRPNWLTPRICCVHALLAAGQMDLAVKEAQQALYRAPDRIDAVIAWALAHAAGLAPEDAAGAAALLPTLAHIQQAVPFEPSTLPLQISSLARSGDVKAAGERLAQVVKEAPSLDESTWLKLASISQMYKLDLHDACYQKIENRLGLTPGLATARALELANDGQAEAGKQLLMKAAASSSGRHELAWQVAIGRYLDRIEDQAALAHWVGLSAAYPDSAQVQAMALEMRCIQADQRVQAAMIDRLRQLSGPEAITWRLVQAKWLLNNGQATDRAAEAASLLQSVVAEAPNSLNARIMLASSLNRLNLEDRASSEIIAAANLQPQSVELALEAARRLQARHDFAGAQAHLDRLLSRRDLDALTRARLAAMVARQGQDAKAIAILEELDQQGHVTDTQLMLMAALYRRTADQDKTLAMCTRLLKKPTPAAIEFAANYYTTIGDTESAERVFAMLDTLTLAPGQREMILAGHQQRYGDSAEAARLLEQAARLRPDDVRVHRELIAQHLRMNQPSEAIAALKRAAASMPRDQALQKLNAQSVLVRWAATEPMYASILQDMVQDERRQLATLEALSEIRAMTSESLYTVLGRLRLLCQQHIDHLQLQMLTAQLHLAHGRNQEAATLAAGAMGAFPTAWEPAWMTSEAMAASDRWPEALSAAQQWRNRVSGDPITADMAIAEALLRLNRPGEAARQLSPHMARATADPQKHRDLLQRHLRALLATNRAGEAAELLAPLWAKSAPWRAWSFELAVHREVPVAAAMAWLDRIAQAVPADSHAEQTRMAATWLELGRRGNQATARSRAGAILGELVKRPQAGADDWFLAGMLAEQEGRTGDAEQAYRRALDKNPLLSAANNNLAMLLALDNRNLPEALMLAQTAVKARPQAAFLDTLAFVLHRMGRDEDAVSTSQRALALQPENVQLKARLTALLAHRQGLRAAAATQPGDQP